MQPAHEGHDDGGEAVARRHIRRELPDRTGDLERTGQACSPARCQQRDPHRATCREAGIARGRRRQSTDLLREAGAGAEQEHPQHDHADQRNDQADADARALHQARDLRHHLEGLALWKVEAHRVLQRPGNHVAEHQRRHVHQHQADQDLAGVEAVAQQRHDAGPEHAADDAGSDDGHDDPRAGALVGQQRHVARRDGADHVLPFGTDVPDVGTEADRQPERDDQQRRCLDHQLAQCIAVPDGLVEEHHQALDRVLAEQREQRRADGHGDEQRQDRRAVGPEARELRTRFKLEHVTPPTDHSSIRRSAAPWPPRGPPMATVSPWQSRRAGR